MIILIITLSLILPTRAVCLRTIRCPYFVHKVPIEHGLSHLGLLHVALFGSEATYFGLVEHRIFRLILDARKHLVDSRVVR